MNRGYFEVSYQQAVNQRNWLALLSLILSLVLLVISAFLFFKTERVIIVPPHIEKELWVDGNSVSPTYLEQFGSFTSQLLFTKSASSAANQRSIILRHTDSGYSPSLRHKLIEEEALLKKQNASYVFYPVEITVNPEKMEVLITGDHKYFVGDKQVSSDKAVYLLSFTYNGSGLFLNEVTAKNKD